MFITFEGIDFSGKSTQCSRIAEWYAQHSLPYLTVREPGGTRISESIRMILLDTDHNEMESTTEMLLFSAARSQLVREKILPALQNGITVLADRFHDSTTAYQGFGRGIDLDSIFHINSLATHGINPDLTLYFDIDFTESQKRRQLMNRIRDRMEAADEEFFNRVRAGYLFLADKFSERFVTIDARDNMDAITRNIILLIQSRMT